MNKTAITTALRFAQPLKLNTATHPAIARPFFDETPRYPAGHDMLMLTAHPEFLPEPEPAPLRELTFFNLDRP